MEIRHADLQIEVEEAQDAPAHPVGRHSGQRRRFVDVRRGARLGRGRSGRRVGGSAGVAGSDGKARPGLRSDGPGPFSGRFSSPRRPGP